MIKNTPDPKYFDVSVGFGEHKQTAIDLMTLVIKILNEFEINYFLISGTLLGFKRHNDFIPWDDDIDLIVSDDIFDKIKLIFEKYHKVLIIKFIKQHFIKISFRDEGIKLIKNDCKWPFIDLFVYRIHPGKKIEFFKKLWDVDKFFPPLEKPFLGITVKIPSDTDYFLKRNYGPDYMTVYKSSSYSHKEEKHINKVVAYNIKK
jgi:phosphorylcholine metabolism protein LicD